MSAPAPVFTLAVEVYEKLSFAASSVTLMGENIAGNAPSAALSAQLLGLGRFLREVEARVFDFMVDYPLSDGMSGRKED